MIKIDGVTFTSAIILCITTTLLLYFIFSITKPKFILKKNNELSKIKNVIYAFIFSLIFSIIMYYVSINIDAQYKKKK